MNEKMILAFACRWILVLSFWRPGAVLALVFRAVLVSPFSGLSSWCPGPKVSLQVYKFSLVSKAIVTLL